MNDHSRLRGGLRARRLMYFAAALLFPIAGGCQGRQPGRAPVAIRRDRTSDSLRYVRDSIKWQHDAMVRDSISRTVNTDSLYRMYRSMLHGADVVTTQGLINCEGGRLVWRYGSIPALDAVKRMEDTLWKPEDLEEEKRITARLHSMTVEEMATLGIGRRRCGDWGAHQPQIVDGADLGAIYPRPVRPR